MRSLSWPHSVCWRCRCASGCASHECRHKDRSARGYLGGTHRRCVCNCAEQFPAPYFTVTDCLSDDLAHNRGCPLPIIVRWVERRRDRCQRIAVIANGHEDGKMQTDIAHCHPMSLAISFSER